MNVIKDYPFMSYYVIEPVEKENNMAKSWFDMVKEGHFYAIDEVGNVVDFGKARGWEMESSYGCVPEVTLRVTPIKVMKNEGASAYSSERERVEHLALKAANEENKYMASKLEEENERLKKANEELRQKLANYESDFIKRHSTYGLTQWDYSPADVYATSEMFAENDPYAVYLSTGRSNGKTQMLKEMLNSMYGIKAFNKYDIKKVIFSGPCTIVFWQDGTKTMVRQQENDILDKEKGLAMAIAKKVYGNKSNYNNVLKRWIFGEDWKKKERFVKKAVKLAKKNGDENEANSLLYLLETNLDYAFVSAETYLKDSQSTPLEKAVKTIKNKIDDALSFDFQGKRKDMGVVDEAADPIEKD
ncbi:MAG: hypothetical protein J5617_03805 [Bacilli bacterium]|nr:hypothetical protein [Bacilli bacterium]